MLLFLVTRRQLAIDDHLLCTQVIDHLTFTFRPNQKHHSPDFIKHYSSDAEDHLSGLDNTRILFLA